MAGPALLKQSGIDAATSEDPNAHVDTARMFDMVERLIWLTGEPAVLVHLVDHIPLSAFGALGLAMRSAPRVAGSLQRLAKHLCTMAGGVEVDLVAVDDGSARIAFLRLEPVERLGKRVALESHLLTIVSVERKLTGVPWTPRRVTLPHALPEPVAEAYERFLGCALEVAPGAATLTVDADALGLPHLHGDDEMLQFFDNYLERLLVSDPASRERLAHQVREVLRRRLPRVLRAHEVAAMVGMSRRKFYRCLEDEGTSFGAELDAVRLDLAYALLRSPVLSTAKVADALGFSSPRAFHRAFKRWTGTTPGAYRAGTEAFGGSSCDIAARR